MRVAAVTALVVCLMFGACVSTAFAVEKNSLSTGSEKVLTGNAHVGKKPLGVSSADGADPAVLPTTAGPMLAMDGSFFHTVAFIAAVWAVFLGGMAALAFAMWLVWRRWLS